MSEKEYLDKSREFNLSNALIEAKYLLSPLAKDLMNIGITRIEERDDPNAPLQADIYNVELFKIIGTKRKNNIARDLNAAKDEIQSCKIVITDEKGEFDSYVIAPTCRYHNGVFTICFNASLKEHTLILDNTKYTHISLTTTTMLDTFFTKRLYEILKEEYYRLNPKNLNDHVNKRYGLCELRFMIGLANQKEKAVSDYVNKCKKKKEQIDWEYAYYELCKEKLHDRWDSFKSRVLEVAKKDMGEVAELRFEYEPLKGAHGRIYGIEFSIFPNQPSPEVIVERNKRMQALEDAESDFYKQQDITSYICKNIVAEFEDHSDKFGQSEIMLFLQDADGDEELVRWAILDTDRYNLSHVVENYIGAVRHRIKHHEQYENIVTVGTDGSVETGTVIAEIIEEQKKDKPAKAIAAWAKLKKSEHYDEFCNYVLSEFDMSIDEFNTSVTCEEKVQVFIDWKKENGLIG